MPILYSVGAQSILQYSNTKNNHTHAPTHSHTHTYELGQGKVGGKEKNFYFIFVKYFIIPCVKSVTSKTLD